jgi:hypothetical protein
LRQRGSNIETKKMTQWKQRIRKTLKMDRNKEMSLRFRTKTETERQKDGERDNK